jgi:hypothetical protein
MPRILLPYHPSHTSHYTSDVTRQDEYASRGIQNRTRLGRLIDIPFDDLPLFGGTMLVGCRFDLRSAAPAVTKQFLIMQGHQ